MWLILPMDDICKIAIPTIVSESHGEMFAFHNASIHSVSVKRMTNHPVEMGPLKET